jgi:hypothetical protein
MANIIRHDGVIGVSTAWVLPTRHPAGNSDAIADLTALLTPSGTSSGKSGAVVEPIELKWGVLETDGADDEATAPAPK